MTVRKSVISKVYKTMLVILSIWGLYEHLKTGIAEYGLNIFWFFTVQSNSAILFYYLFFGFRENPSSLRLKGYLLLPILLTGIMNWFILVPIVLQAYGSILPLFNPSNFIVHGVIPLLFLIDWLLFDPKGVYKPYEFLRWCLLPVFYIVIILNRGYFGSPVFDGSLYPYPFFDPIIMGGWVNVFLGLAGFTIAYVLVGYILYKIKK